jgi:hypothetical protein
MEFESEIVPSGNPDSGKKQHALAKSSISLEEAAKQLGRSPDAIKRMALRLGLSLKPKNARKS